MKIKFFLFSLLAIIFLGCSDDEHTLSKQIQNSWKLEGFGNNTEYNEISSCETCYTLTFHNTNKFYGYTLANSIAGEYNINKESISFKDFLMTKVYEPQIKEIKGYFEEYLVLVHSFSITKESLKLYYGDKGEYILFRLIHQDLD